MSKPDLETEAQEFRDRNPDYVPSCENALELDRRRALKGLDFSCKSLEEVWKEMKEEK